MRSQKQKTETRVQREEREWRAFLREAGRHQITGRKPKPVADHGTAYQGQTLKFTICDLTDPDRR